jgi:chemotaxis protein MotB
MPEPQVRKKAEEGLPPWLATFADMMSLLLTFFVLMLSFANMDLVKFKDMMGSIKDAFGVQVQRRSADYIAFSPSRFESKTKDMSEKEKLVLGMVLRVKSLFEGKKKLEGKVDVSADENGVLIRVDNGVLFDSGSAELLSDSKEVLQNIVTLLKENNLNLTVRGHTDNTILDSGKYPSNWELSASRAAATIRYIKKAAPKIASTRLAAVGYADTRPLVPNNSKDNRSLNRRVEFYFHREWVEGW